MIDNEYVTLWYHPEAKIIHHQFHRFIHGEHFRKVLDQGLEVFKEHGANKWLSDDRLNSAVPKEDSAWALNNWNQRMRAAGWKYWAVLYPDKKIGQINLGFFIRELSLVGITAEVFDDVDEALNWLRSVN